jgi:hypothetical protein
MSVCPGCHGVVGRDCFNPQECEWISRDMEMRAFAEQEIARRDYDEMMREQEASFFREREEDYYAHWFDATAAGCA